MKLRLILDLNDDDTFHEDMDPMEVAAAVLATWEHAIADAVWIG